ncbi:hypothetical protein [Flavihumibacter fluvii]|uniref:hypothetical protein n=1 Tax=Flavihumibacter fluvii TaxID=2838157 RepID=UPI001BDEA368|nr:hypothetical protein [Flavihumibacter fluvii]ULQ50679.1 hypothetical protein KJS93_11365 [Flavihumibacter fluvii]
MKKILLTGLLTSFAICLFAQDSTTEKEQSEPKKFDRSRLFVGGNFGLSFGTYTFINISPQVGYRFSNLFAAGLGINGQYSQYTEKYNGEVYYKNEYGVAGMSIFGRIYPIQQAFISLQPELNYIWGNYTQYIPSEYKSSLNGKIIPSLLAGAGAMLPMGGGGGGLIIMAQYDLLNTAGDNVNPGTPYGSNVFFSIGFNVGL